MQAIERFTKQDIPVQIVEGFMPEPDERAEPIAMGRQTIWGGAGKPPSRDVMQAAARAARTEMMQRVREGKATQGSRGGNAGAGRSGGNGARSGSPRMPSPLGDQQPPRVPGQRPAQGRGAYGNGDSRPAPSRSAQSQPDPMRTSVDMMAERGARRGGGGYGGANRNGGSHAGSGGRSGGNSGGFAGGGNGARGPGGSRGSFNR